MPLASTNLPANLSGKDALDWSAGQMDAKRGMELEQAFTLFNELSEQLAQSYQFLEQRVAELQTELCDSKKKEEQASEERDAYETRFEELVNLLPGGVIVLDGRGKIQRCNPAALEILGEPLEGLPWVDVIERSFAPRADDGHEVSLRDGRRVNVATRNLSNTPGQIILLTDLTETRQLQERLNHHRRLSEMGKMVASLAHQIRTPLSAAMLYSDHLQKESLSEEHRLRFAEKLSGRLSCLNQQVRDMLIFARGEIRVAERATLYQLLADVESSVESIIESSQSTLMVESEGGANAEIYCNRDALIGAIGNLVHNAVQAAEGKAHIRLTADTDEAQQYALITVEDDGPGIPEEIISHIDEPFFTTKPTGTGLGLAVVRQVIKAHKGVMAIDQSREVGAKFTLTFPLTAEVLEDSQSGGNNQAVGD